MIMQFIFSMIFSVSLLSPQTSEQINAAKKIIKSKGLNESQVKEIAKSKGYSEKQIQDAARSFKNENKGETKNTDVNNNVISEPVVSQK